MSIEIERKYVIEKPDIEILKSQREYSISKILQIYLTSEAGVTHRVRKREFSGYTVCTETKKIRLDKMSAIEDEHEISSEEFERLARNIKAGTMPILKSRHTFISGDFCFEIDVYPEWKNTAIMEVELEGEDTHFEIPEFIRVIEEVTGNKAYSNASMSKSFPKELEI